MDLDDVRRKRLRLFNPGVDASDTSQPPPQASSAPPAQPVATDMSADEQMARQLQAEWEQEDAAQEATIAPSMPQADPEAMASAGGMPLDADQDERVARQLQEQYNKENSEPSNLTGEPQKSDSNPLGDAGKQAAVPGFPPLAKAKRRSAPGARRPSLPATIAVVAEAVDESEHALAVRNYVKRLKTKCGGCGKTSLDNLEIIVTDRAKKVKAIAKKSSEQGTNSYSTCVIDSGVQCYSCTAKTCMGCGEVMSDGSGDTTEAFEMSMDGYRIVWHCDRGRLAFVWLLLCIYDHLATHNKPQTKVSAAVSTPTKNPSGPQGTRGRARGSVPAGIGYGGNDEFDGYDDYEPDSASDDEDEMINEQLQSPFAMPPGAQFPPSLMQYKYGPGQKLGGEPTAPPSGNNVESNVPGAPPAASNPQMPPYSPFSALASGNGPQGPPGSVFGYSAGYSGSNKPPAKKSGVHGFSDLKHSASAAYGKPSSPQPFRKLELDEAENAALLKAMSGANKWAGSGAAFSPYLSRRNKREQSPERIWEDPDDTLTAVCLAIILPALPSIEGRGMPTGFDFEPPSTLPRMLLRSSILDRAAELLRNDGIDDVARRTSTYQPMIDFVRALYSHPVTSSAVSSPRDVNRACHDLLKVSLSKPTRMPAEPQQTSKPVISCLRDLTSQSKLMLANAFGVNRKEFESDEAQQMLTICESVVDLAELVEANGCAEGAKSNVDDTTAGAKPQRGDNSQEELALSEVPDEVMLENHAYGTEARRQSDPPAGRMRHLIKEVTRLKTSLPPGIFVRYGASRLDVMKILIVGPSDTPYSNGLFEFDLYCGLDFPQSPPKMTFRTTGGGRAHFNPNLYTCGKVCLSLLGTWQGEKWRPNQSTILQILVSLQAMVLCDEPHCNEPSYEGDRGTPQSKAYNRRLYPLTVKFAMLDWLESTKYDLSREAYGSSKSSGRRLGDADEGTTESAVGKGKQGSIWDEVVENHFADQKPILDVIAKWVKDTPLKKPGKGKSRMMPPSSAFMGTGWAGKTLASDLKPGTALGGEPPVDEDTTAAQYVTDQQRVHGDDRMDGHAQDKAASTPNLIAQLKGALNQLEANGGGGGYHGHAFPPGQFDEEEQQDYDEEM